MMTPKLAGIITTTSELRPSLKFVQKAMRESESVAHELPRFSSPEMQMARTLNKIAIHSVKSPKKFTYPKASHEDLKRLTSTTLEASYQRAVWTNPKDGKIYHLLKEKELDNGNIAIKILNEDGSFHKNAEITPKKILILDNFDTKDGYGLSHGELVSTFLRRNNPFAKIEEINHGDSYILTGKNLEEFKKIAERINNGEKIDFINCSNGSIVYSTDKRFQQDNSLLSQIGKHTRVLFASGNEPNNAKNAANQILVLNKNLEGVGALSPNTGSISTFSASRNSFFTQHYEVGEYRMRPTPHGINITGLPGTDFVPTKSNLKELQKNMFAGKSVDRVTKFINNIQGRIRDLYSEKSKLYSPNLSISELIEKQKIIDSRMNILQMRKRKIFDALADCQPVNGVYELRNASLSGTSFSTPVRVAKLALNDMLKDIL